MNRRKVALLLSGLLLLATLAGCTPQRPTGPQSTQPPFNPVYGADHQGVYTPSPTGNPTGGPVRGFKNTGYAEFFETVFDEQLQTWKLAPNPDKQFHESLGAPYNTSANGPKHWGFAESQVFLFSGETQEQANKRVWVESEKQKVSTNYQYAVDFVLHFEWGRQQLANNWFMSAGHSDRNALVDQIAKELDEGNYTNTNTVRNIALAILDMIDYDRSGFGETSGTWCYARINKKFDDERLHQHLTVESGTIKTRKVFHVILTDGSAANIWSYVHEQDRNNDGTRETYVVNFFDFIHPGGGSSRPTPVPTQPGVTLIPPSNPPTPPPDTSTPLPPTQTLPPKPTDTVSIPGPTNVPPGRTDDLSNPPAETPPPTTPPSEEIISGDPGGW